MITTMSDELRACAVLLDQDINGNQPEVIRRVTKVARDLQYRVDHPIPGQVILPFAIDFGRVR